METTNPSADLASKIATATEQAKMMHFHGLVKPIIARALADLKEKAMQEGCDIEPGLDNHRMHAERDAAELRIIITIPRK